MSAFFSSKEMRPGHPSGLLIISSGGLGDTVLFSLIVDRIAKLAEPGEAITLLLRQDAVKMGFLFAQKIKIQPVDNNKFLKTRAYRREISNQLYRANFRLVISTDYLRHPKIDEVLVGACAAPEALAMEPRPWEKYDKKLSKNRALYARLFDSGPIHLDKVLRWSRFADWLTGSTAPVPPVKIQEGFLPTGDAWPRPTVILVPFSAVSEKQSPPETFKRIVDRLGSDFDYVIAGAPSDLKTNPEYETLLSRPNVKFDDSKFEELAPKLKQAKLVVSVDTATMHLAVAVGAPVVCLASAAYVNEIVPYAPEITPDNVRFVYTPMSCEGCLGDCILPMEHNRFPCVARLDEAKIFAAVDAMLIP